MHISAADRALLTATRRGVLATIGSDGRPRLVPVVFAADLDRQPARIWLPLDDKPKAVSDVRRLARVRDIERDARVSLLVDRWSEDWSELEWLRLDGEARFVEPDEAPAEHSHAVELLRARYVQYLERPLESWPLLLIEVSATRRWAAR